MKSPSTLLVDYVIQMEVYILSILYVSVEKLNLPCFPCSQNNKLVAQDICAAWSVALLEVVLLLGFDILLQYP